MRKVLVLGDVILDRTISVCYVGQSPENVNTPVLEPTSWDTNLGGAGNVLMNVMSLGHPVDKLLGLFLVSMDEDGDEVARLLNCPAAESCFDAYYGGETFTKTRYLTSGGVLFRVDTGSQGEVDAGYWDKGKVALRLMKEMEATPPPVVCLVDYGKGFFQHPAIFIKCLKPGSCIVADPGRQGGWARFQSGQTIFKANVKQAVAQQVEASKGRSGLVPVLAYENDFEPNEVYADHYYKAIAQSLVSNLSACRISYQAVVLTLGAGGCMLIAREHDPVRFSNPACPVIDVTGAGDTFMAALAVSLAYRDELAYTDLVASCRFAVNASHIAVQKRGVAAVSEAQMREHKL